MPDLSIVLFSRQRIDVYPDNTHISDSLLLLISPLAGLQYVLDESAVRPVHRGLSGV
jgi:hypothetical protein